MKKFFKISSQEIKYYVDNKLFRSDIIRNIFFPSYAIGEDVVFTFHAIANSERIVESDKRMYYYRRGSGVTGSFNNKYFDLKQVWNEIYLSAKEEYPQYLEWAKVNKARINFTLLSELALSKEYKSNQYKAKREELIKELKKNRSVDQIRYCMDSKSSHIALLCELQSYSKNNKSFVN